MPAHLCCESCSFLQADGRRAGRWRRPTCACGSTRPRRCASWSAGAGAARCCCWAARGSRPTAATPRATPAPSSPPPCAPSAPPRASTSPSARSGPLPPPGCQAQSVYCIASCMSAQGGGEQSGFLRSSLGGLGLVQHSCLAEQRSGAERSSASSSSPPGLCHAGRVWGIQGRGSGTHEKKDRGRVVCITK